MVPRPVNRYWSSAQGTALPSQASSLIFLVRSASDLLLFPVTAFLAWELAANVYSAANASDRAWMRDSVRDDNVGARLDLQTALAMRRDESSLIESAMVPLTLLVASSQLQSVATLGMDERLNVAHFEMGLHPAQLSANLDAVAALALEPGQVHLVAEGTTEIDLNLAQLARLLELGSPASTGAGFAVRLTAADVLDAPALDLLEQAARDVTVKAEAMVVVEVTDTLDAALRSVRALMDHTDVSLFKLQVSSQDQAQLSLAALALWRSAADRIQIDLAPGLEGLSLVLPSLRQMERTLASPSELLKLVQLGIHELALLEGVDQPLKLNLPQWHLLDLLGLHIGSDLRVALSVKDPLDLKSMLAKNIGNDVNQATVLVEDLTDLGLRGVQDLARQGYLISTADADALDAVSLDPNEISALMREPAQWFYQLSAAGVRVVDFEAPVILSEQATRALLDATLVAGPTQTVVGTLSAQSVPDEFFNNLGQWMRDKGLDALEWVAATGQAPAAYVLDQSLAEFSEWALDPSLDVRFKGFAIGIPDHLLSLQSEQWVAAVESHLGVQVVGISASDITFLPGH